ncbi:unnamed protein product [Zymoseptoria tritici ST99CH_3D1]|uniref:Uncharacterized protein n=1 Tax=Zymoseptoria tritici (strain ST99CH_3D7) TaxID=1276538 RepID=A0A1X7RG65_ZYMT9|nr:unnamed protein product [Zymoseptoria tritici ST99CH_3D7]SMR44724.1 unnamed protein product [Zymoseptoria tritici ST99CH_3D1]
MKNTTLALVASLLVASGMCGFDVQTFKGMNDKAVSRHAVKRDGGHFLWNPDNTAYCTDGSQCIGWCGFMEDYLANTPNADGCAQNNLCYCQTTDPKATCEYMVGHPVLDSCTRGGSVLDLGSQYEGICVSACQPDDPREKEHGGNGMCNASTDPCLKA